jgi:hypothetical protein
LSLVSVRKALRQALQDIDAAANAIMDRPA